ncbi:hypothetical protein LEL_02107 [Akanthomyces lecanii RCEF 1005]|uniref:Uncharacterized protein n=1 Tax=Akanthomyces lecanii RCEF 1005 TaxID=1081108 RepID=A0A162KHK6_CORDF|nr:hypothetical protein LEL_02107 [Akanthomyces lecanii RCEF 1005]
MIEPLQNLKIIRQTSERTHFDLDLDSRRDCRFYYDVGSDDLIALNEGKESIWLVALNVGAATGPNQTLCLDPGEKNPISPGYWGMTAFLEEDESGPVTAEEDEPRPLMAECLLLPRRWTFQQFPVPLAGLVTPGESPADDVAWTTQIICSNFGDGDNPMLKVGPATMVRIRFPTAPGEPESTGNFDITTNIATPTS